MRFSARLILAAGLAFLFVLLPTVDARPSSYRVKERSSAVRAVTESPSAGSAANSPLRSIAAIASPDAWVSLGPADPDALVEFHLFLHSSGAGKMAEMASDVSDPTSNSYGQPLPQTYLDSLSAPTPAASAAVSAWLSSAGVSSEQVEKTRAGDKLRILAPVSVAEQLLNTTFSALCHPRSGETAIRTHAYALPDDVYDHVDFVRPTVSLPPPPMHSHRHSRSKSSRRGLRSPAPAPESDIAGLGACFRSLSARAHARAPAQIAAHAAKRRAQRARRARLISAGGRGNGKTRVEAERKSKGQVESKGKPASKGARAPRKGRWSAGGFRTAAVTDDGEEQEQVDRVASNAIEFDFPTVEPPLLRTIYNTTGYVASHPNTTIAIAGFYEQYLSSHDTELFAAKYLPGEPVPDVTIIGDNDEALPGAEASLDVQWLLAMAPGAQLSYWSIDGRMPGAPDNEPFLDLLVALADDPAPPSVLSISYGDDEHSVPEEYAARVDTELQRAGLRGISVIVASGDGGVAGAHSQECTEFIPVYPASSPWVTSVGGTTSSSPEIGASLSGGGFSRRSPRPSYQTDAVSQYLTTADAEGSLPSSKLFNVDGRGFPDVSAQALRFPVFVDGKKVVQDGTSAAAPVFAAVIGLLNDIRAHAGKGPLGFLNPLLYKTAAHKGGLQDVTRGTNPGCDTAGFSAVAGWDPVTGLGTPDFQALAQIVEALP